MKKRRRQSSEGSVDSDDSPQSGAPAAPTGHSPATDPRGIPDPYYPIYLPIDQAFKAKYIFHQRRSKTFQERVYVFLEHPQGWLCFFYHFFVSVTTSYRLMLIFDFIIRLSRVVFGSTSTYRHYILTRCSHWLFNPGHILIRPHLQ